MNIRLKYGSGFIDLSLPDEQIIGVYAPNDKKAVENLNQAIRNSLTYPIGSRRLDQMVQSNHKVVVLVDDATRSVPSAELLVPIVEELAGARVPDKNICVLVARGLHRRMKHKELGTVLGSLKDRIKIVNHDPDKNLKYLGRTCLGTHIYLNRTFLDADIKILTGDVEFHQFCGYGGGAKSVHPGIADRESIRLAHSRMEMEGTGPARVKGNPVRQEINEVGRLAGVDFIVNVVLNPAKEVVRVFSGNVVSAFLAATKVCDEIYCVDVPGRVDVVIASAGGFPKDIDLYQAQKAVASAMRIVKRDGKIILLAECREGHGSDLAYSWARQAKSADDIIQRIRAKFVMGGHKAYQLARATMWADVYLLSSLKPQVVREFFMHPLSCVEEIYNLVGENDSIAVLPEATLTLAKLKQQNEAI